MTIFSQRTIKNYYQLLQWTSLVKNYPKLSQNYFLVNNIQQQPTTIMMMFMFVMMQGVDAHIYAEGEEEDGADHAEPLLDGMQAVGQVGYADGTVADQPRDEHDRQTRTQAEDDGQHPVPWRGQGDSNVDHRDEVHQTMRAEGDSEEDT